MKLPIIQSPEDWVTVAGKLVDARTDTPIGAKIIYERLPDGKDMGIWQSDPKTGEFEIKLPIGFLYSIRAESKDFISESQTLDLRNAGKDKKQIVFRLRPIEVVHIEENAMFTMNSIFFDYDKAVLKPESFPELERVVQMLNDKPTMSIEIAGHTDNRGTISYNQNLSERRAKAVKKFLTSKGIDASKVTTIGYGETKPIVSNDDEKDGREINRRVEFKITSM